MTLMEFFGCTFLAFGPIFSLFFWTIAREPLKVILFISAAFFWLLSLLLSSIVWYAVVPLRDELIFGLIFSVIFQELFRFGYYALLKKAERGLQKFTDTGRPAPPTGPSNPGSGGMQLNKSRYTIAFVGGQGFGSVSAAFSLMNLLSDISGPGSVGITGSDSPHSFTIITVILTLIFYTLHICWTLILYWGMERGGDNPLYKYMSLCFILVTHLLASCITVVNEHPSPDMYAVSVTVDALVCVGLLVFTVWATDIITLFKPRHTMTTAVLAPPHADNTATSRSGPSTAVVT